MTKLNKVFLALLFILITAGILYPQGGRDKNTREDTTLRTEPSGTKDTDKADTSKGSQNIKMLRDTTNKPENAKEKIQLGTPRVLRVIDQIELDNIADINDAIIVEIYNFEYFWNESSSKKKKILLYLNGHALNGIEPQQNAENQLRFELQINEKNKDSWEKILNWNFENIKKVAITVGLEEGIPLPTDVKEANAFELLIVPRWTWLLFLAIMLGILLLIIWAASRTGLLREKGYPLPEGEQRVFSLGLTQMAFWIYIVFGSFVLLFIVMRQIPSFNTSVLVLIGISSLTAFTSSLINSAKFDREKSSRTSIKAEIDMLSERLGALDTELAQKDLAQSDRILLQQERDTKQVKLRELSAELSGKRAAALYPKSRGFLLDIFADGGEVNLYRVQIILWTLILGGIFLYKVIKELSMPEYDATLLSLMGISSGTYIGFKLPEKLNT